MFEGIRVFIYNARHRRARPIRAMTSDERRRAEEFIEDEEWRIGHGFPPELGPNDVFEVRVDREHDDE